MSDREIEFNNTSSTAKTLSHLPPSDAEKSEYKAKLAKVLDRGLVVDMLHIELPPEVHGEWVSRDSAFITQKELLGFQIDTEYAPNKSKHDHGDGTANVGDVVFMTIPKWKKQMIDDVAKQRYVDTHIRDRRKQKEERDFEELNKGIGMPPTIESKAEDVSGSEIEESLTTK